MKRKKVAKYIFFFVDYDSLEGHSEQLDVTTSETKDMFFLPITLCARNAENFPYIRVPHRPCPGLSQKGP